MIFRTLQLGGILRYGAGILVAMILAGCSTTPSVNWDNRIGTYTWDDALAELGTPTSVTNLQGGGKSAEWVSTRGLSGPTEPAPPPYTRSEAITPSMTYGSTAPDKVLRLMFTQDGKLFDFYKNY